MLKNNPDIAQIVWFDARRQVIDALPGAQPADSELEAFGPPVTQKAFELASRLNKRVYSEPFFLRGNTAHFALAVPVFAERKLSGMLVVSYSIDSHARQSRAVVVRREIPGGGGQRQRRTVRRQIELSKARPIFPTNCPSSHRAMV